MSSRQLRTRRAHRSPPDDEDRVKRRKVQAISKFQSSVHRRSLPKFQKGLLLHAIRQPYDLSVEHEIPKLLQGHELLVRVHAAGLNPIDWKSPDFNFGVPTLPFLSGRESVGTVVKGSKGPTSRIKEGDVVIVPSTDYRDLRKAAFQEYAVASSFNTIRLPTSVSIESGSILGVAFVSAVLTLGVCMGLSFKDIAAGPDLLSILHQLNPETIPEDIRKECLQGILTHERAKAGDWLVIWGGSSTCAHIVAQIAKLAGIKVLSVVDSAKHGYRLSATESTRPDFLVDSHDTTRAIDIIRTTNARFGFDTQGKETAGHLLKALASPVSKLPESLKADRPKEFKLPTPPATPSQESKGGAKSHLIGLTGLPKTDIPEQAILHNVPIKLFHESPEIGEALSSWCERLLVQGLLVPPSVVGTVNGLEGINEGLDRMRRREVSGGRLVALFS